MGVVIAAAAIAFGLFGTASSSVTTLRGHVNLEPVETQCGVKSCTKPAANLVIHLRARSGKELGVRTNARGDFRLVVAPGFYTVSTPLTETTPSATIAPHRIWLHPRQDVQLVFAYRPGR